MDHSVFISYSSSDKASAEQICASLESSGIGCWIAPRDIKPGADYPAAILEGLDQARAVVFVVSAASVESPHILTEVGHAFSKRKPIIPFRLSNTELPPDFDYFLSLSQWLDAHEGCTPQNMVRLKDAIEHAQSARVKKIVAGGGSDIATGSGGNRNTTLLLVLALAIVVVIGIAVWKRPWRRGMRQVDAKTEAKRGVTGEKKDEKAEANAAAGGVAANAPWVNPKDGLTYVWIPPGKFVMGCSAGDAQCAPDESPSHPVEIPNGFWMGQTEVTAGAYHALFPATKRPDTKLPVVSISWKGAKAYCTRAGGRLPTEAEWEYAARAGTTSSYYGVLSKIAWYDPNSDGNRHEVGTKQPNAFGLYDMLGNAAEWVADRYYNKYDLEAPATGKVEEPLASNATLCARGGYWESEAVNVRVSHRMPVDIGDPGPMVGVRCVIDHK